MSPIPGTPPKAPLLVFAFALLSADNAAAQRRKDEPIDRVWATFNAADRDKNGSLEAREASLAQIPALDFATHDDDKDKTLSKDEFLLYYRHVLKVRGRAVHKDIEEAASKVLAERVRAEKARAEAERGRPAPKVDPAERSTENRLREAQEELEAQRRAAAQAEAMRRAGEQRAAEAQRRAGEQEARAETRVASVEESARRAQQHVAGLVEAGRLSAQEARSLFVSLTAVGQPGAAKSAAELRGALLDARGRVGTLVEGGQLSAEQGRDLTSTFDRRAAAAALAFGEPVEAAVEKAQPQDAPEKPPTVQPGVGPDAAPKTPADAPAGTPTDASAGAPAGAAAPVRKPAPAPVVTAAPLPVGTVPAHRAQELVKDLVEQGRVPAGEARTLFQALLLPDEPGAAASAPLHRRALKVARERVANLVASGHLSVTDARTLSRTFDDRARAATRVFGEAVESSNAADELPAQEPARRAQQLVKRLIDQGRVTPREGRAMFQSILAAGEQGAAQDAGQLRDALSLARLRLQGLAQRGHLSAEEARIMSQVFDERAAAAVQGSTPGSKRSPQPAGQGPAPAPLTPERRAQALAKSLVDTGRLSTTQARELYQALAKPGEPGSLGAQAHRKVLSRSRARLTALVDQGKLTTEEARLLGERLDARAALLPPAPKDQPEDKAQPKDKPQPEDKGGAQPKDSPQPEDKGEAQPKKKVQPESGRGRTPRGERGGDTRPNGGRSGGTQRGGE